jgi:hypothetical protein
MSRVLAFGLAAFLITSSIGCATIATGGGGRQSVSVTTEPPGAEVIVNGQSVGPSPVNVLLSRKSEHIVEVQSPGYESAKVMIRSRFNPWVVGNIVVGGLIGVVVDVVTDATWTLSSDALNIQLKPLSLPAPAAVSPSAPAPTVK